MPESSLERLRDVALDRDADETSRSDAVRGLADLRSREAVEALLELGNRPDDAESILRAAGAGLASLQAHGVAVSEWDLRDLSGPAADSFFE